MLSQSLDFLLVVFLTLATSLMEIKLDS
jgi:hypothetical protein